ncbi:MAG: hypothetical protein U9N41_05015 [Euryarchaeota archaeon]|nr:hypothetical protein [Euryarchaeota archaeon]
MGEGVLGKDIKMGEEVWDDDEFLEKVKEICVNNHIKWISREELREFLENVKGILVNNPNEFVTIKEIANDNAIKEIIKGKWNLCNDPDYVVRWFLCVPIDWLSPDILYLECRTHADYAQWALKYNPDKQRDYQYRREEYSERMRQLEQGLRQARQNLYDETIKEMVKFFPDFEREEELRRQDDILDELDEWKRRLEEQRREENRRR